LLVLLSLLSSVLFRTVSPVSVSLVSLSVAISVLMLVMASSVVQSILPASVSCNHVGIIAAVALVYRFCVSVPCFSVIGFFACFPWIGFSNPLFAVVVLNLSSSPTWSVFTCVSFFSLNCLIIPSLSVSPCALTRSMMDVACAGSYVFLSVSLLLVTL
jgi:hypothetical protein